MSKGAKQKFEEDVMFFIDEIRTSDQNELIIHVMVDDYMCYFIYIINKPRKCTYFHVNDKTVRCSITYIHTDIQTNRHDRL